jgi:hypothetical protein
LAIGISSFPLVSYVPEWIHSELKLYHGYKAADLFAKVCSTNRKIDMPGISSKTIQHSLTSFCISSAKSGICRGALRIILPIED